MGSVLRSSGRPGRAWGRIPWCGRLSLLGVCELPECALVVGEGLRGPVYTMTRLSHCLLGPGGDSPRQVCKLRGLGPRPEGGSQTGRTLSLPCLSFPPHLLHVQPTSDPADSAPSAAQTAHFFPSPGPPRSTPPPTGIPAPTQDCPPRVHASPPPGLLHQGLNGL